MVGQEVVGWLNVEMSKAALDAERRQAVPALTGVRVDPDHVTEINQAPEIVRPQPLYWNLVVSTR
jgi:hypothetical protein